MTCVKTRLSPSRFSTITRSLRPPGCSRDFALCFLCKKSLAGSCLLRATFLGCSGRCTSRLEETGQLKNADADRSFRKKLVSGKPINWYYTGETSPANIAAITGGDDIPYMDRVVHQMLVAQCGVGIDDVRYWLRRKERFSVLEMQIQFVSTRSAAIVKCRYNRFRGLIVS